MTLSLFRHASSATFVRLMDTVLSGCKDFSDSFIDDVGIFRNNLELHFHICGLYFRRNVRPTQCFLVYMSIGLSAQQVENGTIQPLQDKVGLFVYYQNLLLRRNIISWSDRIL